MSRKWCDYFYSDTIVFTENYEYSSGINSFRLTDVEQILLCMIQLTLIGGRTCLPGVILADIIILVSSAVNNSFELRLLVTSLHYQYIALSI